MDEAQESRENTSHTYNKEVAEEIVQNVIDSYYPLFQELITRLEKEIDQKARPVCYNTIALMPFDSRQIQYGKLPTFLQLILPSKRLFFLVPGPREMHTPDRISTWP